jgi:hypothetical protein
MEVNTTVNHLDITIHRTPKNWTTSMYKKPTFTDTVIPYTSNHPTQHKYATVKFLYNGLNIHTTYKIMSTNKRKTSYTTLCTTTPSQYKNKKKKNTAKSRPKKHQQTTQTTEHK